jgi:hypothetical protein
MIHKKVETYLNELPISMVDTDKIREVVISCIASHYGEEAASFRAFLALRQCFRQMSGNGCDVEARLQVILPLQSPPIRSRHDHLLKELIQPRQERQRVVSMPFRKSALSAIKRWFLV